MAESSSFVSKDKINAIRPLLATPLITKEIYKNETNSEITSETSTSSSIQKIKSLKERKEEKEGELEQLKKTHQLRLATINKEKEDNIENLDKSSQINSLKLKRHNTLLAENQKIKEDLLNKKETLKNKYRRQEEEENREITSIINKAKGKQKDILEFLGENTKIDYNLKVDSYKELEQTPEEIIDSATSILSKCEMYMESLIKSLKYEGLNNPLKEITDKKIKRDTTKSIYKSIYNSLINTVEMVDGTINQQQKIKKFLEGKSKIEKSLFTIYLVLDEIIKDYSSTKKQYNNEIIEEFKSYQTLRKEEYDLKIEEIKEEFDNTIKNLSKLNKEELRLNIIERFEYEVEQERSRYETQRQKILSYIDGINEEIDILEEKLKEKGKQPILLENDLAIEIKNKKDEVKKHIDLWRDYNILTQLTLNLDLPKQIKDMGLHFNSDYRTLKLPDKDLEEKVRKIYYDIELNKIIEELEIKIKGLQEKGETLEVLLKLLEDLNEIEASVYLLDTDLFVGKKLDTAEGLKVRENLRIDTKRKPMCIVYKNIEAEKIAIQFAKSIVMQIMANHSPKAIKVNIINPEKSPEFSDITINNTIINEDGKTIKLAPYCTQYTSPEEINELVKNQTDKIIKLNQNTKGKSLDEYVKEKKKLGSVTEVIDINLIFRGPDSSPFDDFIEHGDSHTILNIELVNLNNKIKNENDVNKIDESILKKLVKYRNFFEIITIKNNTKKFIYSEQIENNKSRLNLFDFVPIDENIMEVRDNLDRRFKSLKGEVLLTEDLMKDVLGDQPYMSMSARKNIKLYLGWKDGDRTQPVPVILDEEDSPHGFFAGATGGGKSNTLAVITNMLKACYPPEDVALFYFDFKIVEAMMHASPYKWGHCKAISGSVVPEYLISLLNKITEEHFRRTNELFKPAGVVKLSAYWDYLENKKRELIEQGKPEEAKKIIKPPRIVVLIDELVQGYSIDDEVSKEMDKSLSEIARLARATGIHLLLVSQAPDGKIKDVVMNNIRVRGCTKAPKSTSVEVLHTDFASRPENQYQGFFGVNATGTKDENACIKYLVPFNRPETSQRMNKIIEDLCNNKEYLIRDPFIFSDEEPYEVETFKRDINSDDMELSIGDIVLGEPILFHENRELFKINLEAESAENILLVSEKENIRQELLRNILTFTKDKKWKTMTIAFASENMYEYFKPVKEWINLLVETDEYAIVEPEKFNLWLDGAILGKPVEKLIPYYEDLLEKTTSTTEGEGVEEEITTFSSPYRPLLEMRKGGIKASKEQNPNLKVKDLEPRLVIIVDIEKSSIYKKGEMEYSSLNSVFKELASLRIHIALTTGEQQIVNKLDASFRHKLYKQVAGMATNLPNPAQVKELEPRFTKYIDLQKGNKDKGLKLKTPV